MFIDEECENLIVVNQKKNSEVLQLDAHYLTNVVGERISPITIGIL